MAEKIGFLWQVEIKVAYKRWFPTLDNGSHVTTEAEAKGFHATPSYALVCASAELPDLHDKLVEIIGQDYGEQGVHDGIGTHWSYEVLTAECKGHVRL